MEFYIKNNIKLLYFTHTYALYSYHGIKYQNTMDHQTAAVYSVLKQRECLDSAGNAIGSCYCGPKDIRLGKVARVLCRLSTAPTVIGIFGILTGILPYAIWCSLGCIGMTGCAITPCIGNSGRCCNTEMLSSNVQDQSVIVTQPQSSSLMLAVTVQPSSSVQQASTSSVVAQVHRK